MDLSRDQHNAIVAHLTHFRHDLKCYVCRNSDWGIEGVLLSLSEFHESGWGAMGVPVNFKARTLPVAICSCRTCGYSFLINAVTAGVVPQPPQNWGGVR